MSESSRAGLARFAWLSIAAALATIALKFGAYALTGSVGLLSDALESLVNLVAAIGALIALIVAARPANAHYHFARTKAEYLSAVVEGVMIFVAAVFIIISSVRRFLDPQPLENVGVGLGISVVAALLNGAVALLLLRAGRRESSVTLVADGKHLMTDVWTSVGVVIGVLLVAATGVLRLDPVIALLVGINIIWTGYRLISSSARRAARPGARPRQAGRDRRDPGRVRRRRGPLPRRTNARGGTPLLRDDARPGARVLVRGPRARPRRERRASAV